MENPSINEATSKNLPTCFVLMPISDVHGYEPGHFGRVYEHLLKPAIVKAGFQPLRADDEVKTDYIVVSIIQKIVESEMVICDLSSRNANVMYELGIRHAFNKPVALIKDRLTDKIFDIQGLRYTEYDSSLRIDSVQKEILKIAETVKETSSGSSGVNSIVQLAGIKTAEMPTGQTVSADTTLLLSAIAGLEKRMDGIDRANLETTRFFKIQDNQVICADSTALTIGDEGFDANGTSIGTLVDIHPAEQKIFFREKNGKVVPYYAYSVKSKGISLLPF